MLTRKQQKLIRRASKTYNPVKALRDIKVEREMYIGILR